MLTAEQQAQRVGKRRAKAGQDERQLLREMDAAKALRESLAAFEDDADLLRDTIEGETSLHEMIARLVDAIQSDAELVAGIKVRETDLSERKGRLKRGIERKRALIEQAMAIGELERLTLPEVTLSLGKKAQGVVIEDEAAIPSDYWRTPAPTLDTTALKDALKAGTAIPGASLDNGGVRLSIRRK